MSAIDEIIHEIVNAGVELELARRKSCSQVARITAAMEHLKKAHEKLSPIIPWEEAILEGIAVSEAPTIPEEVPRADAGQSTRESGHPPGCRHGSTKPSGPSGQ